MWCTRLRLIYRVAFSLFKNSFIGPIEHASVRRPRGRRSPTYRVRTESRDLRARRPQLSRESGPVPGAEPNVASFHHIPRSSTYQLKKGGLQKCDVRLPRGEGPRLCQIPGRLPTLELGPPPRLQRIGF